MTAAPARGLLVVVAGPSGVGKGTVVAEVVGRLPEARLSVSATTRPSRPGEVDGIDYHFVDDATFDRMAAGGHLLEWAEYTGARYGTPQAWVEEALSAGHVVVLEIEIQGALQVRERAPDALLVFIAPPDLDELERRLATRGTEDGEQRALRLATARQELARIDEFDAVVVNEDVDRCADEIVDLILEARASGGG